MPTAARKLATQQDFYITETEYLDGEKLAKDRHEYVDGQVTMMAGTSKRHNEIAVNITTALRIAARQSPCKVFASDVKVRIKGQKAYYYPDVMVGCETDEADDYYLEKPCLIVEVLSDSTTRRDYLEKALAYQSLPSLQAYLIVAQDKLQVEMLYREEDGHWWVTSFEQADDEIILPCPTMALPLAAIYEDTGLLQQIP